MRKVVWVLVVVSLVLALPVTKAPAATPRAWTVLAGGGIPDTSIVANAFFPRNLEVAVGDTVKWEFQEPWTLHTVTFTGGGQPPDPFVPERGKLYVRSDIWFKMGAGRYAGTGFINSGVPAQGPKAPHTSYTVTFTKAGTYQYFCSLHPPMTGTIVVKDQAAGSPAAALAQAKKDLAATLSAGQAAYAKWEPEHQSTAIVLPMVGDVKAGWTNLRFSRQPVVVKAGTTVTWVVRDPFEIHTVTFTPAGQPAPEFLLLEKQQSGAPRLVANPKLTNPTQAKSYDGMGYVNSGIIFPSEAPGNMLKTFSLTFSKPGKYEYWCGIHAPWGMKGTIVVQ